MIVHEFDRVQLKDGRTGTVTDICKGAYSVDVNRSDGGWDIELLTIDDIEKVVQEQR